MTFPSPFSLAHDIEPLRLVETFHPPSVRMWIMFDGDWRRERSMAIRAAFPLNKLRILSKRPSERRHQDRPRNLALKQPSLESISPIAHIKLGWTRHGVHTNPDHAWASRKEIAFSAKFFVRPQPPIPCRVRHPWTPFGWLWFCHATIPGKCGDPPSERGILVQPNDDTTSSGSELVPELGQCCF